MEEQQFLSSSNAGYLRVLNLPQVRFTQGNYSSPFLGLATDFPHKLAPKTKARVLVLYDRNQSLKKTNFLRKLLQPFPRWRGFLKTFGINLEFTEEPINAVDSNSLIASIEEKLRTAKDFDLLMIIAPDALIDQAYYDLKRITWGSGFKSQFVEIENTIDKIVDGNDVYALMNLANGIFVKLNGIPWVIVGREKAGFLGYIGLSFTKVAIGSNINYGVAYIFDKRGYFFDVQISNYKLPEFTDSSGTTRVSGYYLPTAQMYQVLTSAIQSLRNLENISTSERATLVLHKTARIHDDEIAAANAVAAEQNVDISLVHVEMNNPYKAFQKQSDIDSCVLRGTYLNIIEERGILWTVGARRDKAEPKVKHPLEINVAAIASPDRNKIKYSALEASEQIYNLTMMNWKGGNVKSEPATIRYAREAARLLQHGIPVNSNNWSLVI